MPPLPLSLLPCLVLAPVLSRAAAPLPAPRDLGSVLAAPACAEPGPAAAARRLSLAAPPPAEHRFWDRRNLLLFAAVGASRGLDYSSTLNMRRRGRDELLLTNDVVDNHPAFAAIEAGGVAVSIAASYLFHRSHHHRLERWTSIVHAGLATGGAIRNYCLKTAQTSPAP